jgi:hypothetical protein
MWVLHFHQPEAMGFLACHVGIAFSPPIVNCISITMWVLYLRNPQTIWISSRHVGISFEIYTCGHTTFVQSWTFQYLDDVFFFQEIGKVNGIQVPFTIGIQTLIQCQSMLSCGHNGIISMDAKFYTNDTKLHLFTLMGFDAHHTCVPLTWIITS